MLIVVCIYETKKTGGWVPAFSSLFFCFWLLLDFQSFLLNGNSRKATFEGQRRKQKKGAIEKGINDAKQKTHFTLIFWKKCLIKSQISTKKEHTRSLSNGGTHTRARASF